MNEVSDSEDRTDIIRMPSPLTQLETIQNALAARGVGSEQIRLVDIQTDPNGGKRLTLSVSQESLDAIIRLIGITLHSPDKSGVTVGNVQVKMASIEEEPATGKSWEVRQKKRQTLKDDASRDRR